MPEDVKNVKLEPFWRVIYDDGTFMDKYGWGKEHKHTEIDEKKLTRIDILALVGDEKIGPIISIPFFPDCMEKILQYDVEIEKKLGNDGILEKQGTTHRRLIFGVRVNKKHQMIWSLDDEGNLKMEKSLDFDNIPK